MLFRATTVILFLLPIVLVWTGQGTMVAPLPRRADPNPHT